MKGMPKLIPAVVVVLVAASACSASQSSPTPAKLTAAQQGQAIIKAQKQVPVLQTAGNFCVQGIQHAIAEDAKDTAISKGLDNIDPTGGQALAWKLYNLEGDQVTMKKELASGQIISGTFDLGQIIYALIDEIGEQATKGTPDELQWKLFGLIGPAAIYCAEAAWWLDGTVGGQIGAALQKQFLTLPVGQQVLASRGSAIAGKWVLYRKAESCDVTGGNNHGCVLNPMDVTIACSGPACTIIRTNSGLPGYPPWDHAIPIAFSEDVWQAKGSEQWAFECNHNSVPGSTVSLALKVTSGLVVAGVWRAQGLEGSYTGTNPATSCFAAGTGVEEVSTTKFPG